ncbi:MAG TPA: translation initiation factor IF-2 [Candidatus Acidoferrales bacterium]|nr:translation initiation factor IF-2 [Candidatus Acidoferrales bacterium]
MTDPNQIRINELARELEVKAKAIIDVLPELGVTEKKTHSSSLDIPVAEKVRRHFRAEADAEAEAEARAAADKASKEAAAKAARMRPAGAPAPAAPKPAAPSAPVGAKPVVPVSPAAPPPAAPVAAKPTIVPPAAARPVAPPVPASPVAKPPAQGQRPFVPAAPGQVADRPAAAAPLVPGAPRPAGQVPPRPAGAPPSGPMRGVPLRQTLPPGAQRPGAPRPGGPQSFRPAAAGQQPSGRPMGPRPGQPIGQRPGPGGPGRYPQRPGGPGGRPMGPRPGGPRPMGGGGGLPPLGKAEPGKPIYERKPAPPRGRPTMDRRFDEGERKLHPVRSRAGAAQRAVRAEVPAPVERPPRDITITEGITVRELAEKLDVRAKELLKVLLDRGMFASINQALDTPTATSLAEAFNGVVKVVSFEEEAVQEVANEETPGNLVPRPPVVTVMGHVDHGKTSLLDAIRETDVAAGEAGGITQHIGAYTVNAHGRRIVFIDTPGHEAFTRMRSRGAKVTDIVVLVVAADDGVMPQTLEAIDHAKAAGVPIIVAVNKIDTPAAQPDRVKRQLGDRGLLPEEWGGDTVTVEVSARQKTNIDKLLEMILLVADLRELKANPQAPASGTVLESRVDRGRGPVATMLVQNGTLHAGEFFICGAVFGKVRAMFDDKGQTIKKAEPATPVEVLGLQGVPEAGDQFHVTDEAKARHIVEYRQEKIRAATLARSAGARLTLDQLHEQLRAGEVKELPIVIKADVQGSVEVLSEMLPKLSTDQVKLEIIHRSVGAVSENDVLLASASNAIIIAFNVRPERKAADLAQQEGVDIRTYSIIYEVSDEIKKAMAGLLAPVIKETHLGRAEVRNTFRIKGVGMIAGCYITDGIVKRDAEVRVVRDGVVTYTGRIASLRRFKEDVNEVRNGYECGIGVSNFNDVKVGDILECFKMEKTAAVLDVAAAERPRQQDAGEMRAR